MKKTVALLLVFVWSVVAISVVSADDLYCDATYN